MTRASPTILLAPALLLLLACDPGPAQNSGTVSLTQATVAGARSHTLSGAFYDVTLNDALDGLLPGCERRAEAGLCRAIDCAGTGPGAGASAGTIRVSVQGTEVLSADRGEMGTYGAGGSGEVFSPGDTITFSATGADVGAFEGSVRGPEAPELELPSTIARSVDLTLRWSASLAADDVLVSLAPTSGGTLVQCRVAASLGEVTIDAGLLGVLGTGNFIVGVSAYNSDWVRPGGFSPGDYDVLVMASESLYGAAVVE